MDLSNTVYALDSTTIDLCPSLFPWASFRSTKAAVKMHMLLDLRGKVKQVSQILKAISTPGKAGRRRYERKGLEVVQSLREMKLQKASDRVEAVIEETLTYYSYPPAYRIQISTNNPLERIMRVIRRRSLVDRIDIDNFYHGRNIFFRSIAIPANPGFS